MQHQRALCPCLHVSQIVTETYIYLYMYVCKGACLGIIVYGNISYIDVQTNTGLQQEVEFQAIVATCVFCDYIHSVLCIMLSNSYSLS